MPNNTYSTAGTYNWTCPAGVTSANVEVWGAGGSGASSSVANNGGGGGGGGGAYARNNGLSVTAGTNYTVVVGAGGARVSGNANGANGNDSRFGANVVSAQGGRRGLRTGTAGAGGTVASSNGQTEYAGGAGAARASNQGGGGGAGAGTTAVGAAASGTTGGGAANGGGGGGNGGASNSNGYNFASAPGAGGGGSGNNTGGTKYSGGGADGQVIITWADVPVTVLADYMYVSAVQRDLTIEVVFQAEVSVSVDCLVAFATQYGSHSSTQTHIALEAGAAFSAGAVQYDPTISTVQGATDVTITADCLSATADQYGSHASTQTHIQLDASAPQPAKAVLYEPTISVEVNTSGDETVIVSALSATAVQYDVTVATTGGVTISADLLTGVGYQHSTFDGCDLTIGPDHLVGGAVLCEPSITTTSSGGATISADLMSATAVQQTATVATVRSVSVDAGLLVANAVQQTATVSTTSGSTAVTVSADCLSGTAVQETATGVSSVNISVAADLLVANAVQETATVLSMGAIVVQADLLTVTGGMSEPTEATVKFVVVSADCLAWNAVQYSSTMTSPRVVTVDLLTAVSTQRDPTPATTKNISIAVDSLVLGATQFDCAMLTTGNLIIQVDPMTATGGLYNPNVILIWASGFVDCDLENVMPDVGFDYSEPGVEFDYLEPGIGFDYSEPDVDFVGARPYVVVTGEAK